ncbi:uncharacterized protein BDZ99DRAFT_479727 [Mytilinidion resinicola]|uniref:Uncharacterized protein n=1 Tax=Mytilinidion resinicola TaxID=574789 RepID=A0A6A6YD81_9PEZI|nr:uncharacterized protein BDZ99DRAFT_479727 [Mytilinidion resinicola]KAF2806483.1 hypothetical protein BDZ99DRAFT_479727 [Mytilinidion resinicola]
MASSRFEVSNDARSSISRLGPDPQSTPTFCQTDKDLGLQDEDDLLKLMMEERVSGPDQEESSRFPDAHAIFRDFCLPHQSTAKDAKGPNLSDVLAQVEYGFGRREVKRKLSSPLWGCDTKDEYRYYDEVSHYARFIYLIILEWDKNLQVRCSDRSRRPWARRSTQERVIVVKDLYRLVQCIRQHCCDPSQPHPIIQALDQARPKINIIPPIDYEPTCFEQMLQLLPLKRSLLRFVAAVFRDPAFIHTYMNFRDECLDGVAYLHLHYTKADGPRADDVVNEVLSHIDSTIGKRPISQKYSSATTDQRKDWTVLEHYSYIVFQFAASWRTRWNNFMVWPEDDADSDKSLRRLILIKLLFLVRCIKNQHHSTRQTSIMQRL